MDQTPAILPELQSLRNSIDNIDAAIIHMLAERFRCTQRVGVLKAENDLPPADPAREKRQVARLRELAAAAQLDPDFAEKYLAFVVREVIRYHEAAARELAERTAG
ncbi:chorismate mutase [Aureimonas sp. SK2]|uniref:chorismate mutase n=1 Tax=Aureimonas sp. SK2 TaxID=3015992 RepID=UPI002443E90F|nr:chorismate mutase [Aureimonas sp. SK2]